MQRESLYKERVIDGIKQIEYYARLMAKKPPKQPEIIYPKNRTDPFSRFISSVTGFIDGGFQARNTSLCRKNMIVFANIMNKLSESIYWEDENNTVYFSTRALKYVHPCMFHCYFSGKETVQTLNEYLMINSE